MKYEIALNGRTYEVEVEYAEAMLMEEFSRFAPAPAAPVVEPAPVAEAAPAAAPVVGDGQAVESPMPGTILKMCVKAGDSVKEGDVLCILEAMKMENEIMAPRAGVVKQVVAEKGTAVDTGAVLAVLS